MIMYIKAPKHRMLDTTTEVQDGDGVETIHLQQTALRLAAQDLSFEDLSPIWMGFEWEYHWK